jgi:hypothetical protein
VLDTTHAKNLGIGARCVRQHARRRAQRCLAASGGREGSTASRASRALVYIESRATFLGMESDKRTIDRSLADRFLAAQGGDKDALA